MIKTLLASVREYKKLSIVTILLTTLEVVFEIAIPMCMAQLIDYGIEQGSMNTVVKYALILTIFALMQLGGGVMSSITASRSAAGFAANLRQDMYDKVMRFSFANIDRFSTSSIVTRLTTDITNIQFSYQLIIKMAIRAPIMMIFAMIVAISIDVEISMVFLILIPLLGVGFYLVLKRAHPVFHKVFTTYDKLNNSVQENVRGIRVIKSFNRESNETSKFERVSETIRRDFVRGERLIVLSFPMLQSAVYIAMVLISWLGANAIIASGNDPMIGLTVGDLTALFTYSMQILMSLMMLAVVFSMITISRASMERVVELLKEEVDITNPENPVFEVKDGSITYKNVDFMYDKTGKKKVIDDVCIDIRSGETVGIIGGTGSSKTSLVQLIPRLYDVTGGSVQVGGVDVRDYDITHLRDAVAMVLQKNELFSGTIRENLLWGNRCASDEEIYEACRLACIDDFIDSLPDGLDTQIKQGGVNVSGGQKQRLCIARALLKKPRILILDDSSSAVDTGTEARIQKAFRERIPNVTKLIIAQRVSSVQYADRIIVLDDGKISDIGTHDDLLERNSIYRDVYSMCTKGGALNE